MQRKSFFKHFISLVLYMVAGNVMCTVMTVSMASFVNIEIMRYVSVLPTFLLFHALMFNAGYKDGLHEKKLIDMKRNENTKLSKYRWILIGAAVFGVAVIPTVILIICKLSGGFDFLILYRFISGAIYPLALLVSGNKISEMPLYAPFIFALFYALIPVACQIGFKTALSGKISIEKIMYK